MTKCWLVMFAGVYSDTVSSFFFRIFDYFCSTNLWSYIINTQNSRTGLVGGERGRTTARIAVRGATIWHGTIVFHYRKAVVLYRPRTLSLSIGSFPKRERFRMGCWFRRIYWHFFLFGYESLFVGMITNLIISTNKHIAHIHCNTLPTTILPPQGYRHFYLSTRPVYVQVKNFDATVE